MLEIENASQHLCSQVGLDKETNKQILNSLDKLVWEIPSTDKVFLNRDLNDHVGINRNVHERVHREHGFKDRNDVEKPSDFALEIDFGSVNTLYKKREKYQ